MDINPLFSYIRLQKLGKRPVDNWRGAPRSLLDDVKRWASDGYNLGVLTSRASGVWVLDIDVDVHTRKPSPEWEMMAFTNPIPSTYTVTSPSGGIHYYFRQPEKTIHNNQSGLIAPGVDVRGDGGYVLAAGSKLDYVKHGVRIVGEYEVINDSKPAQTPQWLLDRFVEHEAKKVEREQRIVRERASVAPKAFTEGDKWDQMARSELNSLMAMASQLAQLPDGKRLDIFGEMRGWEDNNGFFVLATAIIAVARWPHTSVTVDQAHAAWARRVPPHYRNHTWANALDSADATWEYGDRQRERADIDEMFGF